MHFLLKLSEPSNIYQNNPKYWDRQAFANSVDPDQIPHNVVSDQVLHCYTYSKSLDTSTGSKMDYVKF